MEIIGFGAKIRTAIIYDNRRHVCRDCKRITNDPVSPELTHAPHCRCGGTMLPYKEAILAGLVPKPDVSNLAQYNRKRAG